MCTPTQRFRDHFEWACSCRSDSTQSTQGFLADQFPSPPRRSVPRLSPVSGQNSAPEPSEPTRFICAVEQRNERSQFVFTVKRPTLDPLNLDRWSWSLLTCRVSK